jgi:uncharacterized protein (TIGR02284 family)
MDTENTIGVLNGLIETCRDGQYGFQEAAENVESPELKQIFGDAALERSRFVGELQEHVRALGGDPENSGSVAASLHRTWIDIKGTLTGKSDQSILSECERGEDSAVEAYEDAIEENEITGDVRQTIDRQYAAVKQVHDRIKQLRSKRARA